MAKQISLNLTIKGVKQNIKSINDLENAIKGAQEELKGIEIGSDKFNQLTKDVNQAKSAFKDLEKSFEGQDIEQRVGAFAKLGEGIAGAFVAAQSAVSLFGGDTTEITEAQKKAQEGLNIVLGARAIAESLVQVRTVAQTIATVASTAATNASTVATRKLYLLLAANPIGAIVAAIGALVVAYNLWGEETDKLVETQKELLSVGSEEAVKLDRQRILLTENNGLRSLQKQAIEELTKQYPGFNAFLDAENKLNEDGATFLKLKIEQLKLEAKARVLITKLSEAEIKLATAQGKDREELLTWIDQVEIALSPLNREYVKYIKSGERFVEANKDAIEEIEALTTLIEENDKALNANIKSQDPYIKAIKAQAKADEQAAKNKEKLKAFQEALANAYIKGTKATQDYSKSVEEYIKTQKRLEEQQKRLLAQGFEQTTLEKLKELNAARSESIKKLDDAATTYFKQIEKLKQVPEEDALERGFVKLREKLQEQFRTGSVDFRKAIEETFGDITKLTADQRNLVLELGKSYEVLSTSIGEIPALKSIITSLKDVNTTIDDTIPDGDKLRSGFDAFNFLFQEISASLRGFTKEVDAEGNVIDVIFDPIKARENADKYIAVLKEALLIPTQKELLRVAKETKEAEVKRQEDLIKNSKLTGDRLNEEKLKLAELKGELVGITNNIKELDKTKTGSEALSKGLISDEALKQTEANIGKITEIGVAIDGVEQKTLAYVANLKKIRKENEGNLTQALLGDLYANIDLIATDILKVQSTTLTQAEKENQKFIEETKKDLEGQQKFREQLLALGAITEETTYDQLLRAYILYKKKQADENKKKNDEIIADNQRVADEFNKKIGNIAAGIQGFSQTLGQLNSLFTQNVQTQLDTLEINQKKALESVVGDSEAAAAKRLEIEKEYNEQRKKLEKEAQITSLKITLAQTIADSAAALVKAFAVGGPVIGQILGVANAIITAAQVVSIQQQISNIQSLRRGGIIKQKTAAGGMLLSGPSHEGGGIPLAQYGVIAEGQEAIINRQSTVNYKGLLSTINQAGGGKPLVVNNFDDSRIVEAIASQKQMPLRAYVLESEITNQQGISKRLDDLSKL